MPVWDVAQGAGGFIRGEWDDGIVGRAGSEFAYDALLDILPGGSTRGPAGQTAGTQTGKTLEPAPIAPKGPFTRQFQWVNQGTPSNPQYERMPVHEVKGGGPQIFAPGPPVPHQPMATPNPEVGGMTSEEIAALRDTSFRPDMGHAPPKADTSWSSTLHIPQKVKTAAQSAILGGMLFTTTPSVGQLYTPAPIAQQVESAPETLQGDSPLLAEAVAKSDPAIAQKGDPTVGTFLQAASRSYN